jgi:hypothetical protein
MKRFLTWLRSRRLEKLREQEAVVQAAIDSEACITRRTGQVFPAIEASNAREMARIKFQIARLEGLLDVAKGTV